MRRMQWVVMAGAVLFASPAGADSPLSVPVGGGLLQCAAITDAAERVRCYDKVTGVVVEEAPPQQFTGGGGGTANDFYAWAVHQEADKDGHKEIELAMRSNNVAYDGDLFARPQATLMLRCINRESALWVSFETPKLFPSSVPVSYKLDGEAVSGERWQPSQSGTSVGLWHKEAASDLMRRMVTHTRFVFHADLSDGKSVVASFELGGLPEVVEPMRAACRW